jgi:Alpha/beta hydrolase family
VRPMPSAFVLVAGPLVRASSWEPTARHLRQAGWHVQVPDILAHHASPPAWSAWSKHLLDHIAPASDMVLVGHSSASVLVAELATRLPTRSVIIVDGEVPPPEGAASPVRPALRDFIRSLAAADGTLPVWSNWFSGDAARAALVGIDILAGDPLAFARFEQGLPTMQAEWFDDTIELASWNHIPAGFIQTSKIYDHAAAEAERRGWPVTIIQGTHLHPTLRPAETAEALLSMSRRLGAAR